MLSLESLRQNIAENPRRAGVYAFAGLVLAALVLFATDYLLRPDTFPVRSVSFEGPFIHVEEQALAAAVVETARGNFFLLNLDAVRRAAGRVSCVDAVSVQRRWPDGVLVRFTEQELAARWVSGGWVNVRGEHVDLQGRPGPEGLPRLAGPDGMQARVLEHYRQLDGILASAGLQVAALTLTSRHAWNVVLANGLVLTLGREQPEEKVARFAQAWPQALAVQVARIRRVDLRYTNGFAVEWDQRAGTPRASEMIRTGLNKG
jgi:cell division protein FtsQ